jgi:hypothetical protein
VIDHVVRTERLHPVAGFCARGGADHGQAGELAGQLYQDRTYATGGADDQQALLLVALAFLDLQALEQQFPGGYGG